MTDEQRKSGGWLDWLNRKPKVDPAPPIPDGSTLNTRQWLQILQILKKTPLKDVAPAVIATGLVVFFAISGILAWIVLVFGFMWSFFSLLFRRKRNG
jgi:hypothetical protein